jgi:hypothetical protein
MSVGLGAIPKFSSAFLGELPDDNSKEAVTASFKITT